jgi:periplasmic copper chaperone A
MIGKLALAAVLAIAATAAGAHEYSVGTLEIVHPWTRATPKSAPVAGGYLKITNKGQTADRLLSASSLSAPRVEIHEMTMSGGTMRMRPLPKGLEIKPGETVELKPGSFHIMFMNLTQGFEQGQRIKGTLIFEKAGPVEIEYVVEAPAGASTSGHRH